ncbi:MAG: hypothetical protein ACHQNE_00485 [Candidatus Kapaibacterium sp.]
MLILCIIAICLVTLGSASYAQVRNIAPYLGASGSLGFIDSPLGYGWGIEGGVRFFSFYAGLEDGAYYAIPVVSQTYSAPPSSVKYMGIHAGILNDSSTLIGIVVLQSHKVWDSFDSTNTFWDFGIDVKHSLSESHIYIAFALSYRRLLKLGLGYMF